MNRITLDRRGFLAGAGASLLIGCTEALAADSSKGDVLFASGFKSPDGEFGLAILNESSEIISQHILPARGHGIAASGPAERVIIFARRPGNFALCFSASHEFEPFLFNAPIDRHFYGHGAFSPDGNLLYTTENDFEGARGVIGVYNVRDNFRRLGEFYSGGIGPHEVLVSQDGKRLCVANGGIKTHPQFGREKLNLNSMRSNIVIIDSDNGQIIERHELPEHWSRLSMRHMAFDGAGQIWIGGQYEGNALDHPPLIGCLAPGEPLEMIDLPEQHNRSFRNYIGSVAVSGDGSKVGITSPKGGQFLMLDAKTRKVSNVASREGVCGLASAGAEFIASSEIGMFSDKSHPVFWDNHIVRLM